MIVTRCDGGCGMEAPGSPPAGDWMMVRARKASEFLKSAANEPDKVYCPDCWGLLNTQIAVLPRNVVNVVAVASLPPQAGLGSRTP